MKLGFKKLGKELKKDGFQKFKNDPSKIYPNLAIDGLMHEFSIFWFFFKNKKILVWKIPIFVLMTTIMTILSPHLEKFSDS